MNPHTLTAAQRAAGALELAVDLVMSPLVMRIFFTNNPADMDFLERVVSVALKGLGFKS